MRRMSSWIVGVPSLMGRTVIPARSPCAFILTPYLLAQATIAWTSSVMPGRTAAARRGHVVTLRPAAPGRRAIGRRRSRARRGRVTRCRAPRCLRAPGRPRQEVVLTARNLGRRRGLGVSRSSAAFPTRGPVRRARATSWTLIGVGVARRSAARPHEVQFAPRSRPVTIASAPVDLRPPRSRYAAVEAENSGKRLASGTTGATAPGRLAVAFHLYQFQAGDGGEHIARRAHKYRTHLCIAGGADRRRPPGRRSSSPHRSRRRTARPAGRGGTDRGR